MTEINYSKIPEILKEKNAWCVWRYEKRDGKPTKVPRRPYSLTGAKSNHPHTWVSYEIAVDCCEKRKLAGIGYFLHDDDCGVDLDDCVINGVISDEAKEIIAALNTYAEISPSGTGVKLLGRATLPPADRKKDNYEVYDKSSPRFFALTGNHVEGTPTTINDCQEPITAFHAKYIARPKKAEKAGEKHHSQILTPTDTSIVEKLRNQSDGQLMSALLDGDSDFLISMGYGKDGGLDRSRCDFRLATAIGFYTDCREQLTRIFETSGLDLSKWHKRKDYQEKIISAALAPDRERFSGVFPADSSGVDDVINPFPSDAKYVYTIPELYKLPDPEWLIEDHFQTNSLNVIVGAPGCCKSFYALSMGLCVSTGLPFLGHKLKQGGVMYVCSEGSSHMKFRCKAWFADNNVTIPTNFHVANRSFDFCNDKDTEYFLSLCKGKLQMIIVDTLSRNFGGGDENSPRDMGAFLHNMDVIRIRTGAAVVIIHHTGKDASKKERGHSKLRGAADTILLLDFTNVNKTGVLIKCDKQKDAPEFERYSLLKKEHTLGTDANGKPITSLTLAVEDKLLLKWRLLKKEIKELFYQLKDRFNADSFTKADAAKVSTVSTATTYRYLTQMEQEKVIEKAKGGFILSHDFLNLVFDNSL